MYGFELMRLKDCYGCEFVLGVMYEEVIILFVCDEVKFYKCFFLILY